MRAVSVLLQTVCVVRRCAVRRGAVAEPTRARQVGFSIWFWFSFWSLRSRLHATSMGCFLPLAPIVSCSCLLLA